MSDADNRSGNTLFGRILIITVTFVLSTLFGAFAVFDIMGILSFVFSAVAAAILAFGFFVTRSPIVLLSAPAAVIVSTFLTDGRLTPVFSLIFFLPGVALAIAAFLKFKRSEAVVLATAAQALMAIIFAVVSCYAEVGGLSLDGVIVQFAKIIDTIEGVLRNASLYDAEGEVVYLYTAEQIEQLMSYMRIFLPAVIISMASLMSYLASSIFLRILRKTGSAMLLGTPDGTWKFSMSKISAYVFCGSYLTYILTSSSKINSLSATAFNMFIILLLGFARCGMTYVRVLWKRGVPRWTFIVTIIVCVINPVSLLLILALAGVIMTLLPNRKSSTENNTTPKI